MDDEAIKEQVLLEIEKAFDGVPRGKITLHEADVIDEYGSDSARAEARKKDNETRWQDLPDAVIEKNPWGLSYLCPESFRYYIPAYMRWSLKNFQTNSLSIDSTINALANSVSDEHFLIFSSEQKLAIKHYLEYMALHGGDHADSTQAEFALTYYWNHAAPGS